MMLRLVVCLFFAMCSMGFASSPSILYLTWTQDPTTTMTVQWHTAPKEKTSEVLYRKAGDSEWQTKSGGCLRLLKTDYLVHTVELEQLQPNSDYEFSIQGKQGAYKFRTMPKVLDRPVRYVIGGDAYYYFDRFYMMNAQIAAHDPDFVVVGGDIAYSYGHRAVMKRKNWAIDRWRTFLQQWKKQMVTSDGRLIPLLAVVGNHDVRKLRADPERYEVMFYELFAMPDRKVSFRTLDFGQYLSLFLLDSGHSYPVRGRQADWLKQGLGERENFSYKMAVYHVGAYPSVYSYTGAIPEEIRKTWCPLFEKYHLNAAFEHHSHAYKRTHLIKEEKIDPAGVLYLGDGSWGVSPRKVKNAGMWYMARGEQVNAVCLVTLTRQLGAIQALSIDGQIIDAVDTYPISNLVSYNPVRLLR